jgi:mannose-6-phosphate isomerase
MDRLPILKFQPICKPAIWGGRELERLFGRRPPGGDPVGESWEIVDLPGEQSAVADGPLAGTTLADLRRDRRDGLLGPVGLLEGRFPLLVKLLDARRTLSVQVHPDEAACRRVGGGARPKTEAWYVIERDPGAELFVGLREGVDRRLFEESLSQGEVEGLLNRVAVEPGDFVYLPAGTVHAIGAGLVLAEVQQSSDTTYRVFDWNRTGFDGRPRALHVPEALEAIAFGRGGAQPPFRGPASGRPGLRCPSFSMEIVGEDEGVVEISNPGPVALLGVRGGGRRTVSVAGGARGLSRGETLLVPACSSAKVALSAGTLAVLAVLVC